MNKFKKISYTIALTGCVFFSSIAFGVTQGSAATEFTTTPTGYTCAEDVKYVTKGDYIANWGARGEDATFLSKYAQSFYTGSYVYETLSKKQGGTGQGNAPSSALYSSLQTLMTNKHSHKTSYGETRYQYCYTDCVSSNYSNISSFYSGKVLGGSWGSSPTWNREHTWPNSKGLGGQDEDDIMMLRPTATSENSSRGNTAYGQSSGYYDPNKEGTNVRGDCARIVLYTYVRWGNTSYMWGSSGVMESMNVLLQWMEEDPVDTWEMGRNDAVQAITGTRNVFIDYPEYAWLLFGKSVPVDMSTPSMGASSGSGSGESSSGGNSSSDSNSSSGDTETLPSTLTIAEAVTLGASKEHDTHTTEKYYVSGTITEITNTKYGNMYIEDENGDSILVYGLYTEDGTRFDSMATKPKVGDTVKLYSVVGQYNDKPQLKDAWLIEIMQEDTSSKQDSSNTGNSSDVEDSSDTESSVPNDSSTGEQEDSSTTSEGNMSSESGENGNTLGISCQSSVYMATASVMLGIFGAYLLKKRKSND